MADFHLAGIPQATPVRDSNTGLVVDGYRLTVVSNDTGAAAVLEIPKDRYTVEHVTELAERALHHADGVVKAFGTRPPETA